MSGQKKDWGSHPPVFVGLVLALPLGIVLWASLATLISGLF